MKQHELEQALYDNWKTNKNRTRVNWAAFKEIMALIEHRPRVTREFIDKQTRECLLMLAEISPGIDRVGIQTEVWRFLKLMLQEAGIEFGEK